MNKRYLGSLAKNKQLPTAQRRSFFVPPLVSPYGNQRPTSIDDFEVKDKRYLGALARSGDLNFSKPQQKKTVGFLDSEPSPVDEFRSPSPSREKLSNQMLMKQEMIEDLRPVILNELNKYQKSFDQRKVDLFLSNLVNAFYDQNEEISMEYIEALVQSNYFQPEESDDSKTNSTSKRNIQALVRERNVSYGGTTHPEIQPQWVRTPVQEYYRREQDDMVKRNLQSLIKNKLIKRHLGSVAKNYNSRAPPNKRDSIEDLLDYLRETADPYDENVEYTSNVAKRHTMYDINEPDITFEYPTPAGEQADYNDYAEQDTHPISIGKRYLGKPYIIV